MSDVNIDFTVRNSNIAFKVAPNDIKITPTNLQLRFYSTGAAYAGGDNSTVQFNSGGFFAGSTAFTYDAGNSTVLMSKANITVSNLGNVANVHIGGGSNGLFLRTDGNGNLSWAGGNLSVGGANTQIQFNDSASFNGSANFTFNKLTNNLNLTGNLISSNVIGNSISGNALLVTGTTTIQQAQEKVLLVPSSATGTIDYNLLDEAIVYYTGNATTNFTLNFRGNSTSTLNSIMSNGQSMTCTFINTNSSPAYYATIIKIDGTTVIPVWPYPAGAPTQGTSNGKDCYTFNIIKTDSATFTVFASKIGFQ
jgi:hypothetical protein